MKTVLLAEHHAPTLRHLAEALAQHGYSVRTAGDPATAMERLVSERPDAVVLAVDFPRLEGAHLGALVRASDHGARMPLIAIDKGHLGKARGVSAILDIQANAYVADPTKLAELNSKLDALVQAADSAKAAGASGLQAVLARPPVASGELKGYPLPAFIHSLVQLQREGVLVVAFRDLTRRVYFLGGAPVNYDSNARQDSLPNYLVERGDLTPPQAEAVLKALSGGLRIGAALAEAGVDLQGEALHDKLSDYTREKLAQVIGMREGRFAFYAGNEFASEVAAVEVPALAPVLEGARRAFSLKIFAQALRGHLGEFPHRTPEFGKQLPALGLDTQDLKVAMQVNGRILLKDLLAHGRGDLHRSYSLMWFLNLAGCLGFSTTPVAGSAEEQAYTVQDRIAPRKRKPLPPETMARLRDAAVKIITGSYFRVLGLDIAADTEAVEKAYHEVATTFHPDSYPEHDTSEIQDLLDSVQEKLSASYRVLSVEEKRKAYLQYLFSKMDVGVGRATQVNVDAEIALKRGEAALRRKDPRSARIAFESAVALNPREPEYYCHLAWATYLSEDGDIKARAKAAQKLLKKALGLNPYLERAIIITAIIDAELGEHSTARRKLLEVLKLNPGSALAKAALLKVGR